MLPQFAALAKLFEHFELPAQKTTDHESPEQIDADTHFHDDDRHLEDEELDALWVTEMQHRAAERGSEAA